jgi:hypothetical protein
VVLARDSKHRGLILEQRQEPGRQEVEAEGRGSGVKKIKKVHRARRPKMSPPAEKGPIVKKVNYR